MRQTRIARTFDRVTKNPQVPAQTAWRRATN
jgi:hypothetical protein